MTENELVMKSAGMVHEDWCNGEISAFYNRLLKVYDPTKNTIDNLQEACYKNGKIRNELDIDMEWLASNETLSNGLFSNKAVFDLLVQNGVINIKRFAPRFLTEDEQKNIGTDYKPETSEENILKPFDLLSEDSKKENKEAAINALSIYVHLKKAGYTDDDLLDEENQELVGSLIHIAWMSRNKRTEDNAKMFVPYAELDEWGKGQDLAVFAAVVKAARSANYSITPEEEIVVPSISAIRNKEKKVIASALSESSIETPIKQ